MSSSHSIKSKSDFLTHIKSIKDKLRSETSISTDERIVLLAGEILEKVTRKEQGYANE